MIQIPDDLARCLEEVAAAQRKSVEQVALDSLRSLLDKKLACGRIANGPKAATAQAPRDQGAFDEWPTE